jgi:hypothetical protein
MCRSEEAYLASEALHLPRLGFKREYKLQAHQGRQLQEMGYVTDPWTFSLCDLTEGQCRMSVANDIMWPWVELYTTTQATTSTVVTSWAPVSMSGQDIWLWG